MSSDFSQRSNRLLAFVHLLISHTINNKQELAREIWPARIEGYPAGENEKQYKQNVEILFWNTIAINDFTNTFTQFLLLELLSGFSMMHFLIPNIGDLLLAKAHGAMVVHIMHASKVTERV